MVTNRTIAVLLIVSILVSLGGTLLSLGSLSNIGSITGFDITNTNASIDTTITSNTAINISTNSLDFGNGTVAPGCQNCTMHTPRVNDTPDCCIGFKVPGQGIIVENIGNKNVTLNSSLSGNANTIIEGTNPALEYNVTQNETGSCNETTGWDYWWSWSDGNQILCPKFYPDQDHDEIQLDIRIRIPDDSKKGLLNTSFNLTATTI